LVVAQSSSEILEGLMNNSVYYHCRIPHLRWSMQIPLLILMVPMQMQCLSGVIKTTQCYINNVQKTS